MEINSIGESQLSGCPDQYPSVSLIDYHTDLPTARLRALPLIQTSPKPGDRLVKFSSKETDARAGF